MNKSIPFLLVFIAACGTTSATGQVAAQLPDAVLVPVELDAPDPGPALVGLNEWAFTRCPPGDQEGFCLLEMRVVGSPGDRFCPMKDSQHLKMRKRSGAVMTRVLIDGEEKLIPCIERSKAGELFFPSVERDEHVQFIVARRAKELGRFVGDATCDYKKENVTARSANTVNACKDS